MLALTFDPTTGTCDLALTGTGALASDDGLVTAALTSLLSDARAPVGAPLPSGISDRRGWIGDALVPEALGPDTWGSCLWLMSREKQTEAVRARVIALCRDALAWLVSDGAAAAISVDAAWGGSGWLNVTATVTALSGRPLTVTLPTRV